MTPKISVVIPCFNARVFIRPCLDALLAQDWQGFEVIIVDNGSKDGTAELIRKGYPHFALIENRHNLGACKARNQGIEASCGEWVLALDCDVVLEKDFLSRAAEIIEGLPGRIGMVQPKVLLPDKKRIYSTGIRLSALRRFHDIGRNAPDNGRFDMRRPVFGACSCAALYRRKMLADLREETGYFDERFFFLVEDVDVSWRARRKGYQALYAPEARCVHSGNSSATQKKARRYLCWRNRRLMIRKNEKKNMALIKKPLYVVYDLPRFLYLAANGTFAHKPDLGKLC